MQDEPYGDFREQTVPDYPDSSGLPMSKTITRLHEQIMMLQECVSALEMRLQPLLRSSGERLGKENSVAEKKPNTSALVEHLDSETTKLLTLRQRVMDVLDRLDV